LEAARIQAALSNRQPRRGQGMMGRSANRTTATATVSRRLFRSGRRGGSNRRARCSCFVTIPRTIPERRTVGPACILGTRPIGRRRGWRLPSREGRPAATQPSSVPDRLRPGTVRRGLPGTSPGGRSPFPRRGAGPERLLPGPPERTAGAGPLQGMVWGRDAFNTGWVAAVARGSGSDE